MGVTKTQNFTEEQNTVALYAKALAHPARVAIIQHLLKSKTCVCGDIVEELPLSQSTVSQHLKELKKVGLIKGDIEGPTVCYCVDMKMLTRARKLLNDMFQEVHMNCC